MNQGGQKSDARVDLNQEEKEAVEIFKERDKEMVNFTYSKIKIFYKIFF